MIIQKLNYTFTKIWRKTEREITKFLLFPFLDQPRQSSVSDDYASRNGHLPPKPYNERSAGYNSGKWYNEKRNNNRRSEEPRPKPEYNYREQSGSQGTGNANNTNKLRGDQTRERDVTSVDRESNSSVENTNSRRRPKARNTNPSHSGELEINK